jgi:AcrR family transcriptional regulator
LARRSPEGLREVIRDYRRDQIIDEARRLFGERGTTEVSMDEIASAAGVARSTVYVYFSGRDELLRSCLQRMYGQLQEELAEGPAEGDEPVARLRAVVHGVLRVIDESPAFFRLAMAVQGSGDRAGLAIGAELSAIGLDMARLLEELVAEGIVRGDFRKIDPARAGALIGQQLFGAMTVRAGDPSAQPLDVEVEDVFEFILHGLAS